MDAPTTPSPGPPLLGEPAGRDTRAPIGGAVVRGSAWLVFNSGATKGLSLIAQVVLAKLLSDNDFGIYAIAMSLSIFAAMFKDGGVRQLLIQRHAEHDKLIGPVFWMAFAFNLLTAVIMGALGPIAARIYHEPRLATMLWVIALSIPLSTPGAVLAAKLNIDLRFRELAMIQVASAIVRYAGSVALALAGAGPLSFVLPLPVIALIEWGIAFYYNREHLWTRKPRPDLWLGLAAQTIWVLIGTFAVGLTNMGNYLVVGLLVANSVVGVYCFAYQIVVQIGAIVTTNIYQVLFPALTSMGGDRDRQSRAIARAMRQLMLLAAPLGIGLIPTFGPLERIVWHGKWASAVPCVVIIAAFYPATVIHAVPFAALQAWGQFRQWAILLAVQAGGMMAAGAVGAYCGGTAESISLASSGYLFLSVLIFAAIGLRQCGLSIAAILSAAIPAWSLALFSAAAAWYLVNRPLAHIHPITQFLVGGIAFTALYAVLTRAILLSHIREAMLIIPKRLRPLAARALLLSDETAPPGSAMIRAAARFGCTGCSLLASGIMLAWATGRIVSDRFLWSQFLAWIPTALALATAATLLVIACALRPFARPLRGTQRRGVLWLVIAALFACLLAYFALIECRVYRLAGRADTLTAVTPEGGLRILFWNCSATSGADLATSMNLVPSDLAITANPTWERPFTRMAEKFGSPWFINAGQFIVLSRNPVLRWGATSLGLKGREQVPVGPGEFSILPGGGVDIGHAVWMELDTREPLGRTTTVWVLDLPSDERLSRWASALQVATVLRTWPGPAFIPDGRGGIMGQSPCSGFPTPDIVLGDLNTPRGSASLSLLAPGMTDAYDQAGAGYAATFPRQHPVVHIDLTLAAPWLRASDYRIIDPGQARHRMQWTRLVPR